MFDYGYKQSDGYIKDDVVVASSGTGGTIVTGAQRTTDSYGNEKYLIGDKGANAWKSQNIGLKFYLNLPAESKLTLGASRFTYGSFDRNHYNTYIRDTSGNPVSAGNVTLSGTSPNLVVRESSFLTGPDSDIKEQNRYTFDYEKKLSKGSSIKATMGYTDIPLYNNYIVPSSSATLDGGGTASRMLRPNKEVSGSIQLSLPASDRHYLVTGVSSGKRRIDTITYSILDWRNAGATDSIQNRTGGEDFYYALYVQDEITLTDNLTAYLGGRYDHWTTEGFIEQVKAPAYKNSYSPRTQTYVSPKASMVYRPYYTTTLRASIGSAFHTPVLRDTFGWWTPTSGKTYVPNPDLRPETVTSWEAGIEQQAGEGTLLRATYYENRLKDLIYRTEDATTTGIANAGAALIRGIELEARQRILNGLTAFVNATYNDAKITENSAKRATEGKYMTNSPQEMANIGVESMKGHWSGSILGHYVGKVYANDENTDRINGVYGSYDPYFIIDAKASYKVTDMVIFSLSVDNLLDRNYYRSSRAPGREFFGEVSLKF